MNTSIRYVALYESHLVTGLGRIVEDEFGIRGEILNDSQWERLDVVLDVLYSPGYADIVSYEEAKKIASALGMTFD